jgi:hypothetical protein
MSRMCTPGRVPAGAAGRGRPACETHGMLWAWFAAYPLSTLISGAARSSESTRSKMRCPSAFEYQAAIRYCTEAAVRHSPKGTAGGLVPCLGSSSSCCLASPFQCAGR